MKRLAIGVLLVLVGTGCPRPNAGSPLERAVTRGGDRVDDSVRAGARSASERGPFDVPVRYNPADCDCPAYEVFAYGRWIRAFIDAGTEQREELEQLRSGEALDTALLRGRLDDELRAAESRVRYPVFQVSSTTSE